MFYHPRIFLRDLKVFLPLLGAAALMAVQWWQTIFKVDWSQPQLYLHYNVIFGVDLVGGAGRLLVLPAAGSAIFIFNYLVAYWFYPRDRFFSYLLSWFTLVVHVFLWFGLSLIIQLNV